MAWTHCTSQEYGDPFSVMGNYTSFSHYEHTNFARGNFGWLGAASTADSRWFRRKGLKFWAAPADLLPGSSDGSG